MKDRKARTAKISLNSRLRRRRRSSCGSYMVEVLVALVIGAILAFSLTSLFSSNMTSMSTSQNEAYANILVDELIEYSRAADFEYLQSKVGEYSLKINSTSSDGVFRDGVSIPLLLDSDSLSWTSTKSTMSRFHDDLVGIYRIEQGSYPGSILVTASVTWTDSVRSKPRTLSSSISRLSDEGT